MDLYKHDDKLTIVNRSYEYHVDKKIFSKVPYFEKMLCHDSLESKENKVKLDFDEKALKLIFDRIEHDYIFIEMDCVIHLCTIADYFGMDNHLIDDCVTHFHDNFSIEHLPVIIPQVTPTSKLINSGALNTYISRYFTKISNTAAWLDYPIETIEFICALDLMVHSEVQVFEAIMRWITFKYDSRKEYVDELFRLIRWCFLEDKDLFKMNEHKYVKSSKVDLKLCSQHEPDCNCFFDRTKQSYFIAIEELNLTDLRVKILDRYFSLLVDQVMHLDASLPLNLLHEEYISDVFFDSGRKMIRIDWDKNKYRLLESAAFKSHFTKIHKCIFEEQTSGEHYTVKTKASDPNIQDFVYESSLLEANDKFILIRNHEFLFKYWAMPTAENIRSQFDYQNHTYLATVLDNNIFMLSKDLEFFQFNIDCNCMYERIGLERYRDKFTFYSLLLTSSHDKVIFIDKSTKALFCYNVKTKKWSSMGQISSSRSDDQTKSNDLLTFISTFLSMDAIQAYVNQNSNK